MHLHPASTHELESREGDGIHVRLLWDAATDRASVSVEDRRAGTAFTVAVAASDNPLDVFRHPFAYAAWQGVDTSAPAPAPIAAGRPQLANGGDTHVGVRASES